MKMGGEIMRFQTKVLAVALKGREIQKSSLTVHWMWWLRESKAIGQSLGKQLV